MGQPNGLAFSCRKRAEEAFKKRTISRTQRSAAMPGWARSLEYGIPISKMPSYLAQNNVRV